MACENNSNKLGSTAAPQSGVSSIQSKLTGIVGRTMGAINRSRGIAATRTLAVVDSVDMPGSIDSLTPMAAAGALIVGNDDPIRLAKRAIKPGMYFQPDMPEDELVQAEERFELDRKDRVRLEQHELDHIAVQESFFHR